MADFRIQVVVDPSRAVPGARAVRNELQGVENAADRVRRNIAAAFAFIGASALIRSLSGVADAYTNVQNRLRTVTSGQQELADVTSELFAISNRTRVAFEATAELYARVGLAARDLGLSQRQTLQFTESLNQAVQLSGASAAEAQAGLIQLSQGLASGALRGDELNSVLEQLPVVADVIADSLGVTRGQLRELGADGRITADIVIDAFAQAREELEDRFGQAVPTLSQAFVVLQNNVFQAVGAFDQAAGITAGLSTVILALAENLDTAAVAAAALGAVLLTRVAGPAVIAALTALRGPIFALTLAMQSGTLAAFTFGGALSALRGALALIIANPIVAVVAALGAAATALTLVRDRGERVEAQNRFIAETTQEVRAAYSGAADEAGRLSDELARTTRLEILAQLDDAVSEFESDARRLGGTLGLLRDQVDFAFGDEIAVQQIEAFQQAIQDGTLDVQQFQQFISRLGEEFPRLERGALTAIELSRAFEETRNNVDFLEALLRELAGTATAADRALLGVGQSARDAAGAVTLLSSAATSATASLRTLQGFVPELARAARVQAELETAQQAVTAGTAQLQRRLDAGTISLDQYVSGVEELNDAYERAIPEIDGTAEAQRRASEELERFTNDARLAALDDRSRALEIERQRYEDLAASLTEAGASQSDLDAATQAYQQSVAIINQRFDEMAQSGGGAASSVEDLNRVVEEANGGVTALAERITNLRVALEGGLISQQQFNQELRDTALQLLELQIQSGEGTFADGFLLQLGRMQQGIQSFRSSAGQLFGDFFNNFTSGFANAIAGALTGTQSLGDALRNVASQALGQLLAGLIQLGIRFVINATLGRALATAANAAASAQAAALAAAWAPAAALASLATVGTNSAAAIAALTTTTAVATGLASVPRFQDGGLFSGVGGPREDRNLALISNGEFIVNAAATRRNLALLESINAGRTVSPARSMASAASAGAQPSGGTVVVIEPVSTAPGVVQRVEQISEDRVRIIAEEVVEDMADEVVGGAIENPNSRTSRSLARSTNAGRRNR